jgi:hypothetical protein
VKRCGNPKILAHLSPVAKSKTWETCEGEKRPRAGASKYRHLELLFLISVHNGDNRPALPRLCVHAVTSSRRRGCRRVRHVGGIGRYRECEARPKLGVERVQHDFRVFDLLWGRYGRERQGEEKREEKREQEMRGIGWGGKGVSLHVTREILHTPLAPLAT